MLQLRVRVGLGAMAIKGHSAFPKVPALLKPHNQNVWCHIQDICWVVGSYESAEMQTVYFSAPADWAAFVFDDRQIYDIRKTKKKKKRKKKAKK